MEEEMIRQIEVEKSYLDLVYSILEEAALRPIRVKRDGMGRLEIGVSTRLTLWVDCRHAPQVGVWNGEMIKSGSINLGGREVGFTSGMIRAGAEWIPVKNEKAVTWVSQCWSWAGKEVSDLVWKHLPEVRKVIFIQQQPSNKLEVALIRNTSKVPYLHIRDVRRMPGKPEECQYMSWSESNMVALGRSYILGDCPEAVFIEGLCEANEQIRDLVYPKELD